MPPKIALMIDAENISYRLLPDILNTLPVFGQILVRAIYGDWEQPGLQNWREIAEQHNFTLRHQTNDSHTKNSSDMRLIMDAMEIIHHLNVDIFCLVTNDADFVPLCDKIHESNKQVIGIGRQNAADRFVRSCDQFIFIGKKQVSNQLSTKAVDEISTPRTNQQNINTAEMRHLILQAFALTPGNDNHWLNLSKLGNALRQIQVDFRPNNYGYGKLSTFLQSMPDIIELRTHNKGMNARLKKNVRLKCLKELLSLACENAPHIEDGWITLSALGSTLRKIQPGFQSKTYGNAQLSKLLKTMPAFIELRTYNKGMIARLKTKPGQ